MPYICRTREIVKNGIAEFNNAIFELEQELATPNEIQERFEGKAEQLLNINPYWWQDRPYPFVEHPNKLREYGLAVSALNELLDVGFDGKENFEIGE